ncbi:hypothetical protein F511_44971 [Dorcoceras hygrometricum]|uniref:Uncharacterized protein n=1 Tax=Dorcoceras hygrometricum TaxID=472368 RepID=A0A2Z7A4F7_9LAMI|nr:hypothetical protein F511_44971 [Dorcoceras hygrometricum]
MALKLKRFINAVLWISGRYNEGRRVHGGRRAFFVQRHFGEVGHGRFHDRGLSLHQKIKFSVGDSVGEVLGDRKMARKCYVEEVRIEQKAARAWTHDYPRAREDARIRDPAEDMLQSEHGGEARFLTW